MIDKIKYRYNTYDDKYVIYRGRCVVMNYYLIGGTNMKITKLEIEKLHEEYDYSIRFDEKLTFLYGANGAGKTTILNILASIVTGKLYNLAEYEFDKIILYYRKASIKKGKSAELILKRGENDELVVSLNSEIYYIEEFWNIREKLNRKSENDSIERTFSEIYPFSKVIKEIFNYAYLPLNRYGMSIDDEHEMYYRRRGRYMYTSKNPYNTYLNESLFYITEMIRDNCARISVAENGINNKFRQEVLTSSIQVSPKVQVNKILAEIENGTWDVIVESKNAYIRTLEEIGIFNNEVAKQVETFFEEFRQEYEEHQSKKINNSNGVTINLVWQYSEFLKIKNITELAKENERRKEIIRTPKETFLEVITGFFKSSGSDKTIKISSEGMIYFETTGRRNKRKLGLTELSSGEKQIIIIFASLIFGLQGDKAGIYIVDEPEASLHLTWQSQFVETILKINSNVQLIFATHSPELIGNYRKNAVKLEKK